MQRTNAHFHMCAFAFFCVFLLITCKHTQLAEVYDEDHWKEIVCEVCVFDYFPLAVWQSASSVEESKSFSFSLVTSKTAVAAAALFHCLPSTNDRLFVVCLQSTSVDCCSRVSTHIHHKLTDIDTTLVGRLQLMRSGDNVLDERPVTTAATAHWEVTSLLLRDFCLSQIVETFNTKKCA